MTEKNEEPDNFDMVERWSEIAISVSLAVTAVVMTVAAVSLGCISLAYAFVMIPFALIRKS